MTARILTPLLLVMLMTTSCTFLRQIIGISVNPPTIKLKEARLMSVAWTGIDINLVLSIKNTNDVDLEFKDLVYRVKIYDVEVLQGKYAEKITAKSKVTSLVTIPVSVPTSKAGEVFEKILAGVGKETFLVLEAEASFMTELGGINVDFEERKPLVR